MIKRTFLCVCACAFGWAMSGICGVPASDEAPAARSLTEQITGTWTIAPNKRVSTGTLEFKVGGTYEMKETFKNGSSSGTKGQFELDESPTPVRLRLCPGKCTQPGAEWVTRFCIMRLTSPTTLEIYQSTGSSYPKAFPKDKDAKNYMILSKK